MNYLRIAFKNDMKSKLWWLLLVLPIILGLLWGAYQTTVDLQNTKYAIGVVDLDQTLQSKELTNRLSEHPSLSVIEYASGKDAENGLIKKEILQSYIIGKGFEDSLLDGDYRNIVEVVSMIKSPYSDWLNDQISVGVIREWLISDGYLRLQKLSPDYSFENYEEAFLAYYHKNELLGFSVIDQSIDLNALEIEETVDERGFIWLWILYSYIFSIILIRNIHHEWHGDIWKRLKLSGVKEAYYHMRFIIKILVIAFTGSALSLLGSKLLGVNISIVYFNLVVAILSTFMILLIIAYYIVYLPLNKNQCIVVYSCVFAVLCLMSSDYVQFLPFGEWLQFLSPMTLFFKICL